MPDSPRPPKRIGKPRPLPDVEALTAIDDRRAGNRAPFCGAAIRAPIRHGPKPGGLGDPPGESGTGAFRVVAE